MRDLSLSFLREKHLFVSEELDVLSRGDVQRLVELWHDHRQDLLKKSLGIARPDVRSGK